MCARVCVSVSVPVSPTVYRHQSLSKHCQLVADATRGLLWSRECTSISQPVNTRHSRHTRHNVTSSNKCDKTPRLTSAQRSHPMSLLRAICAAQCSVMCSTMQPRYEPPACYMCSTMQPRYEPPACYMCSTMQPRYEPPTCYMCSTMRPRYEPPKCDMCSTMRPR